MRLRSTASLWESLSRAGLESDRSLWASDTTVALAEFASGSVLGKRLGELRGRSVLVSTSDQLAAALALIEIDGIARRLVLCPSDLDPAHLPYVVATAEVDAIVSDRPLEKLCGLGIECIVPIEWTLRPVALEREAKHSTEWRRVTS